MLQQIGNCRVLDEIGTGGMAVVYRALQEPLRRVVAIKALKPTIAVDSQFAERFQREARFMAKLQHENIIHVHDFIADGKSMHIVMEYVQGIDLYDLLERTPVLPAEVAAIIALQVARALDYAHFRGIIHRDIKPANIMVSHQGEVKLMDFGIARDDTLSDLTETGTGLGTPSYMSPEQILGDKLDFRSDIFSLGIVLYQMVTGKKPFVEDQSRTVMQKIRLDKYLQPRKVITTVPRTLERILARCMQKLPANRYTTTQTLIDDLMEFLASRVAMNYNARLVVYLSEVGVITDEEAEHILSASPRAVRGSSIDRKMIRHTVAAQGAILGAALVGGTVVQTADGRFSDAEEEVPAEFGAVTLQERAGFIRVIADPWAEILIDGDRIGTTPLAASIPVLPGVHYVRFENPYYGTVTRKVRLKRGEEKEVFVELKPKESEDSK